MKALEKQILNGTTYLLGADGNFYPQIFGDMEQNQKPLGRFGSQMQSYLMEEQPEYLQELLMEGRLLEHLHQVQQQSMDKYERILEQLKSQTPPPQASDYLTAVRYSRQMEQQAIELVIQELTTK